MAVARANGTPAEGVRGIVRRASGLGLAALLGFVLLAGCGEARPPESSPTPTASPTPAPGGTTAPAATVRPGAASAPVTPSPAAAGPSGRRLPTPPPTATPSPAPTAGAEEVRAALEALPWMRDGVSGGEDDAATTVRYAAEVATASGFADLFVTLTERPWVRDGLAPVEISALFSLVSLAHRDADAAARLLEMPFLASVETRDLGMLEHLRQLPPGALGAALASQRLEGGIGDGDEAAVSALRLAALDPDALSRIERLEWVADGVRAGESGGVLALHELALDSPNVFAAAEERGWLRDGITAAETRALWTLWVMSGRSYAAADEATALRVLAMPFLDEVSGADASALAALARALSASRPLFDRILAHPLLATGITDGHAVRVAALDPVVDEHPERVDAILDRTRTRVETRSVRLPLTGALTLSAVFVEAEPGGTLGILEELVREYEAFMGAAFPVSNITVLVADVAGGPGGGGPRGVITVAPGHGEDRYLIAHELAHVYWPFHPPWIAEGAAELMASLVAELRPLSPCPLAGTLGALDRLAEERDGAGGAVYRGSGCAYSLGRGLFLDLHETLGDEPFRGGFLRLYVALRDEAHEAACAGVERGGCYLDRAFVGDASPGSASLASPVIERWYGTAGE